MSKELSLKSALNVEDGFKKDKDAIILLADADIISVIGAVATIHNVNVEKIDLYEHE